MNYFIIIVIFVSIYISTSYEFCRELNSISKTTDGFNVKSKENGDYTFHSLMTLSNGGDCSSVTAVGLFRMYGVKFAIERINKQKDLLPNVTLGYEVHDGCLSVPIIMSRGIDIVRDYRNTFCRMKDSCNKYTKYDDNSNYYKNQTGQSVAVIGAYYSYASLQLASLLSLHHIPQISYGSSSSLLSKTNLYPSFHRTIPSDDNQIDVFIDILKVMNWNYIFIVAADDDYGKLAIAKMKHVASQHNICIADDMYIPRGVPETKEISMKIVNKIKADEKAKVVVMFGYAQGMADELLRAAQSVHLVRYWLTSEGWNPHILKVNAPPEQLESVLTVSLAKGKLPEFTRYMKNIILKDYKCNIWLKLFLQYQFKCNVTDLIGGYFVGNSTETPTKTCKFPASRVVDYIIKQDPDQVNNLIDAVYALAHGVNNLLRKVCSNQTKPCIPNLNELALTNQLTKVSFVNMQNKIIEFDKNGDITTVEYLIENLQQDKTGDFLYHNVGSWLKTRKQKLQFNSSKVKWPTWFKHDLKSQCSRTCQPGEFVIAKQDCCWECQQCSDNTFSSTINAEHCTPCEVGYHTLDKTKCIQTNIIHLTADSVIGIVILTISCIGTFLVICCAVGFYLKREKNVIASSGKFTTGIAFLVILALFLFVPQLIVKPTNTLCRFKYAYFSLLFTVYTTLLFIQDKSIVNFILKCTTEKEKQRGKLKIIIFFCILSIELCLCVLWFISDSNQLEMYQSKVDEIFIKCNDEFPTIRILMTTYPCFILSIATIAAFPERKNTSNYNFSRYLNYVCLASCIITLSYLFTLRQVKGRFQAIAFSIIINALGFLYLMCILVPRLYWSVMKQEETNQNNTARPRDVNKGFTNNGCEDLNEQTIPKMTRL